MGQRRLTPNYQIISYKLYKLTKSKLAPDDIEQKMIPMINNKCVHKL